MRKLVLLPALLLAFSLAALAQEAGSQTTTQSTTKSTTKTSKSKPAKDAATTEGEKGATASKMGAKSSQLTGCLAKDAAGTGFTLTNGRYTKGVAVTSSQDLSPHVGHEVRLTGTWEKPTTGGAGGGGAQGKTMRSFTATDLKHISDTCTAAGGKKAATKAEAGSKTEATPKK